MAIDRPIVATTMGIMPYLNSGSTMPRLKAQPSTNTATSRWPERPRQRQTGHGSKRQHHEGRQHHELALREVDRAGGLPQQREAQRRQRVDRCRWPGR
jgi:hypothetical protein